MKGVYGGYKKVGFNQVFIRETIHGCDIDNGAVVVTYAALENPDKPGEAEGFYCSAKFTAKDN